MPGYPYIMNNLAFQYAHQLYHKYYRNLLPSTDVRPYALAEQSTNELTMHHLELSLTIYQSHGSDQCLSYKNQRILRQFSRLERQKEVLHHLDRSGSKEQVL